MLPGIVAGSSQGWSPPLVYPAVVAWWPHGPSRVRSSRGRPEVFFENPNARQPSTRNRNQHENETTSTRNNQEKHNTTNTYGYKVKEPQLKIKVETRAKYPSRAPHAATNATDHATAPESCQPLQSRSAFSSRPCRTRATKPTQTSPAKQGHVARSQSRATASIPGVVRRSARMRVRARVFVCVCVCVCVCPSMRPHAASMREKETDMKSESERNDEQK